MNRQMRRSIKGSKVDTLEVTYNVVNIYATQIGIDFEVALDKLRDLNSKIKGGDNNGDREPV